MNTNVATRPLSSQLQLPGPGDLGAIAVLLDVDGTILDTAITPGSVVVPGSLRSSLDDLHAKCAGAVALVSGRLIRNLRCPPRGRPAQVAAAAASDPRVILEDKGSSLAVHYRLAPHLEQTLKAKIAAIVARIDSRGLDVMHGHAVIEIKPTDFSKGEAVCELMRSPPFAHRKPVFVGDDSTDESVFKVLPMLGGVGYSVERLIPGASGTFASPDEVRGWLARLCGREGSDQQ
jgi:trehalose 6-phosphate phosphatase